MAGKLSAFDRLDVMLNADMEPNENDELKAVARIAAAYFSNNSVSVEEIPAVIEVIRNSLLKNSDLQEVEPKRRRPRRPDLQLAKESILEDRLKCLECGKELKSLKRHLDKVHNMSPTDYCVKHNLPLDYPMVHPEHSKMRSQNARRSGLGRNPDEL